MQGYSLGARCPCLLPEHLLHEFQHISFSPWSLHGRWCRGEPLTSPGNQTRPNVVAFLWGTVTDGFCFQCFFFRIPHPSLRACEETAPQTILRQKGREPSVGFLRADEVTVLPQAQGCRPGPLLSGPPLPCPSSLEVPPSISHRHCWISPLPCFSLSTFPLDNLENKCTQLF